MIHPNSLTHARALIYEPIPWYLPTCPNKTKLTEHGGSSGNEGGRPVPNLARDTA
jgi:hypothetical protein